MVGEQHNPFYEPPRRRFGTSFVEFLHILGAMTILSFVLWIVFTLNEELEILRGMPQWAIITMAILISLLGFVLHELGHKFTAQHFGHWSEFRANWLWLGVAVVIAFLIKIPIAAPGATWHTAQTRDEQGKISAMGPLVNFAVAVVALFVSILLPADTVGGQLAVIVVFFSAFLGVFNLIPLGPLDGRKVLAWNFIVWLGMVALGVAFLVYAGIQLAPAM